MTNFSLHSFRYFRVVKLLFVCPRGVYKGYVNLKERFCPSRDKNSCTSPSIFILASMFTFYLFRKRTAGTNVITLVSGKKISKIEEEICDDPFKIKSGGLVDMKNMKGTSNAEIIIILNL